jgi:hypothetical protein
LRTYVLDRVFNRRERLVQLALPLVGSTLDAANFPEFVRQLGRGLQGVPLDLVRESVLHTAGRPLTLPSLATEAWRLAGNLERLREYHAVPPWNRQVADEYVPCQVLGVTMEERERRRFAELTLQVLAGTPAGLQLKKTWSSKFVALLSKSLGFAPSWTGSLYFTTPLQLPGLQFYVLLEQRLCGAGPDFEKLWTHERSRRIRPASCLVHNRQLLALRERTTSRYPCVAGLAPNIPCYRCYAGLDRCPLATHARTFPTQFCHFCSREELFDLDLSTRMCRHCFQRRLKGEL